jgi:hypothetical protein
MAWRLLGVSSALRLIFPAFRRGRFPQVPRKIDEAQYPETEHLGRGLFIQWTHVTLPHLFNLLIMMENIRWHGCCDGCSDTTAHIAGNGGSDEGASPEIL